MEIVICLCLSLNAGRRRGSGSDDDPMLMASIDIRGSAGGLFTRATADSLPRGMRAPEADTLLNSLQVCFRAQGRACLSCTPGRVHSLRRSLRIRCQAHTLADVAHPEARMAVGGGTTLRAARHSPCAHKPWPFKPTVPQDCMACSTECFAAVVDGAALWLAQPKLSRLGAFWPEFKTRCGVGGAHWYPAAWQRRLTQRIAAPPHQPGVLGRRGRRSRRRRGRGAPPAGALRTTGRRRTRRVARASRHRPSRRRGRRQQWGGRRCGAAALRCAACC